MALSDRQYEALKQQLATQKERMGESNYNALMTSPAEPQSDPLQRSAKVADTLFGGGKVGEAIGSAYFKYLSPEGKRLRQEAQAGTLDQGAYEELTKGPSAGQVAGSAARSALLFAPVGKMAQGIGAGAQALGMGARTATALGNIGAGAATGYAFDVASNAEQGTPSLKPGMGTAFGAALPATFEVGKAASKALPKLLSYTSDVPDEAFNQLLKNREKTVGAIKAGTTPEMALKDTQSAVRGLRKTLTQEWQDSMRTVIDENAGKRLILPQKDIDLLVRVADDYPIDLPQNVEKMSVKEATDLLKQVNELYGKRAVRESAEGVAVRKLKESLKNKVVDNFGGKGGSVDKLYANYAAKREIHDAANDLVRAYSSGKPIQQSTALGRLKALFNENKSAYLDAILDLEKATGKDLMSKITAVQFADKMPKGTKALTTSGTLQQNKGIVDKAFDLLILPLSSPRSAGWIARNLGNVSDDAFIKGPGDELMKGALGQRVQDSFETAVKTPVGGLSTAAKPAINASNYKAARAGLVDQLNRINTRASNTTNKTELNRLKKAADDIKRQIIEIDNQF